LFAMSLQSSGAVGIGAPRPASTVPARGPPGWLGDLGGDEENVPDGTSSARAAAAEGSAAAVAEGVSVAIDATRQRVLEADRSQADGCEGAELERVGAAVVVAVRPQPQVGEDAVALVDATVTVASVGPEVEDRERERIFVLMGSGNHNYRLIHLDGRSQVGQVSGDDDNPLFYGRSVGEWNGDTLVVSTVGFNEGFWFTNGGLPHTEAVHLVEYFRRPEPGLVEYSFVIDDPDTYEAPVEGRLNLLWREGEELFEYICQQSNYAHELMVNPEDLLAVGRTSRIVP